MALTRAKKESLVDRYKNELAKAPNVFLLGFEGISVPEATELRDKVREVGGTYVVVKNRLAKFAVEGQPLDVLKEHLQGPTAAAFGDDDAVSIAKALTDFAKDVPAVTFKAGLVDGQAVAAADIQEIASLPSREELLAKLLYLLQSPVTRFVRTLAEMPRRAVSILDQIRQAKESSAG
ncbi:MAG: 50S ribosomal protein L10 [Acidobacteriota bacterium]|nr:50S ribosomal protein L10 [Acidobacteriota bacterium]